jgi:hypothetical protein
MNKLLTEHHAWDIITKLKYGFNSSIFISTTRLRERQGIANCRALADLIKYELSVCLENSKIKISVDYGYYNHPQKIMHIYFNIEDTIGIEKMMSLLEKHKHDFEILNIKTPRDAHHHFMIHNNAEMDIRYNLYYNKYRYSVKIILYSQNIDRRKRTVAYIKQHFNDYRLNIAYMYRSLSIHMNQIDQMMLLRLSNELDDVQIKEALLIDDYEKLTTGTIQ